MILISGAAGKTGRAVLRQLKEDGHLVRAFVRHNGQAEKLKSKGAEDTVVGDMVDEGSWLRVAVGVRAIYHICPNLHPLEIEIGRHAIQAAQAQGIETFVYHSVLHPQIEAMPHHWKKLKVEEQLFESGLSWTILQPASYMQNVLPKLPEILDRGIYSVPYPEDTRLGMVDLEDVAQVAVKMLTEGGHVAAIYELAGREVLSQREVAAILADQLGRPVSVGEEKLDDWKARMTGLSEYAIGTLSLMFDYYGKYGFWGNPAILAHLLGREPTTFSEFVRRELASNRS